MPEPLKESVSERIKSFIAGRPELQEASQGTPEKIGNMDAVRAAMKTIAQSCVSSYLKADPGPVTERKAPFDLVNTRIEGPFPIRLKITKQYQWTEQGEFRFQGIIIQLDREENPSEKIAQFNLADYGDEFRIRHREVNPRYRRNGIAEAAEEAMEEFVKEYIRRKPQREPIITANAGQLHVWSLLDKQGFKTTMDPVPVHPGEQAIEVRDIDEILDSLEAEDGQYDIERELYVFPSDFKGPRWIDHGEWSGANIDASARVHFKKRLEVGTARGITDVLTDVRSRVTGVVKGYIDRWTS